MPDLKQESATRSNQSTRRTVAGKRRYYWLLALSVAILVLGYGYEALSKKRIFTPGLAYPSISTITPTSGLAGRSVTINGFNFGATQDTGTVTFNGIDAGIASSWSDTQIVATVPGGATTGPVVVTVNGLDSNSDQTFSVADFTLSANPDSQTVTSGGSTTYTVTLGGSNGFSSSVALGINSGVPLGTTANFAPNPLGPPGTSTLTVTTSGATPTGTFTLVIQGNVGGQTHIASVLLVVTANQPPTAVSQSVITNEDTPILITLSASTTDLASPPLTLAIGAPPTRGTLSPITGILCLPLPLLCFTSVTYTPTANLNRPDSFTFTASDGTNISAPATVSISVTPVNDPPVFDPIIPQSVTVDSTGLTSVTITGVAPGPATATDELASQTVSMTATSSDPTIVPNPTISGLGSTRTLQYQQNPSKTGTVMITVTANDGQPTNNLFQRTFTITQTSLDPRVLKTLNHSTFELISTGGGIPTAFSTDAVKDLKLIRGAYTLRAPSGGGGVSFTFTVNGQCDLTMP